MNYKISPLTAGDLDHIEKTMSEVGFDVVVKNKLQYNHAHELRHWMTDEFLLFRGKISVDNYVAIDLTQRGSGQFLPFAKFRESNSDNYTHRQSAYYLTLKEVRAITEVMDVVQEGFLN